MTDDQFKAVFPAPEQDIAFIEDIPEELDAAIDWPAIWARPINKKSVKGIHGRLFYELDNKKEYYPNRRDRDLDDSRGFSLRDLT